MRLFSHHFLRTFVALLLAVFISNTVYAGGMMVSYDAGGATVSMSPKATDHDIAHHCHDSGGSGQHHAGWDEGAVLAFSTHQSHSQSHSGCSQCNHCMACYSMMIHSPIKLVSEPSQPVLAIAVSVHYLAPTNPQPNKPPIS